jgi:hypothetical protein
MTAASGCSFKLASPITVTLVCEVTGVAFAREQAVATAHSKTNKIVITAKLARVGQAAMALAAVVLMSISLTEVDGLILRV